MNNGLKSNMNNLGLKVEAFIKQQEEVMNSSLHLHSFCLRNKHATRTHTWKCSWSCCDSILCNQNHARTYQTYKSISSSLVHFFKTLRLYISKLTLIEEDSHAITNQKLHAFTTKFEVVCLWEHTALCIYIFPCNTWQFVCFALRRNFL